MNPTNDSVILDVRNLTKRFAGVTAVKNLTFQVKRGEVFGFLGPNGAGKTTTMRIVTCFIPATEGEVKVAGFDTVVNDMEIRKRLGYLPENNPLYNDMLVSEYLRFVGELRGLKGADLNRRMDDMYHVCGLTKMTGRQIGKLSKGFRQRVGLAQAMVHNPELLILDEPMSGLDPNQIVEMRQLIKEIGKEKTVVYCSHILSEVSATCSRILIINDGTAVATGTADELTSKSTSANRYRLRIRGDRASVESKLPTTKGVVSATVLQGANWLEAVVVGEGKEDIGEQLFRCAVDNGWGLAELRRETASLEDVFTQLTRG